MFSQKTPAAGCESLLGSGEVGRPDAVWGWINEAEGSEPDRSLKGQALATEAGEVEEPEQSLAQMMLQAGISAGDDDAASTGGSDEDLLQWQYGRLAWMKRHPSPLRPIIVERKEATYLQELQHRIRERYIGGKPPVKTRFPNKLYMRNAEACVEYLRDVSLQCKARKEAFSSGFPSSDLRMQPRGRSFTF